MSGSYAAGTVAGSGVPKVGADAPMVARAGAGITQAKGVAKARLKIVR